MSNQYMKPVVRVRPILGGQSLLAGSDITITKGSGTYSGSFHAKRFSVWDDEGDPNPKGISQ
jgi:hypothetical protein